MRTLVIATLLLISSGLYANNYYFSFTSGSDNWSTLEAQRPATPWKTLEKLNSILPGLGAGDSIFLKRGDTFFGSISVQNFGNSSQPIFFGAYGSGDKPIVTGFSIPSNWATTTQNIWETTNSAFGASINMVLVNGAVTRVGRYPNYINASDQGFLYYESSAGNTSITDSKMSGLNFTGGDVVIRKSRWVLDRNKITLHSENVINYTSQSGYTPDKGNGYFIQNHLKTLDQEGEWYYDAAQKKLGIFSAGGATALQNVQVSTVALLVSMNSSSNIVFDNIVFTGANTQAFLIKNSQNIRVSNCEILYSGGNAITANNTDHVTIENSIIKYTNNIAFNGLSCTNTTFRNNKVSSTGVFAGMGDGDSGSYEALMISGNNNLIEQNVIDSTGYIPITFSGNNVTIKNNHISNYAFVKDDGGAIYTWNNGSNPPANFERKIVGNIVINGIGAGEGTADRSKKYAHGIYIDDNASDVELSSNTVANCHGFGLYIHNSRNLSIKNNTVYNNEVQLEMQHDDIAPNSPISNNTVIDNILFSLYPNQPVAEYKTKNDDLANFGTFDNNYYCRPVEDNAVINTLKKVNGNYVFSQVDIEGWKAMYGKDANSKKTPKQIAPYKIDEITGNSKFSNSSFSSDISGLYSFSPANNFIQQWNNGAIDAGTLQLSFSSNTGNNNKGSTIINVGAVTANKTYILRFSLKGSDEHKMMEVYLRKSLSPYTDLTDRKLTKIQSGRSEVEFLFIPFESESNASIGIDVPEQTDPVYIDNLQLLEANVTGTDLEDSVKFVYNPAVTAKDFVLNDNFIDVRNKDYNNSISIDAFSSAILLNKANSINPVPVIQCAATGNILREVWSNVGGNNLTDNIWTNAADNTNLISTFEGPTDVADNYATRIRGYLCAPQTGNYTFWIAGDDATELWISTDDNPANKRKIAYNVSWTSPREWEKYSTQKSMQVYLEAGKKYYIEALHKEGGGGDNIAVAWQLPNGIKEAPMSGTYLSPFIISAAASATQNITFNAIDDLIFGVAPFAVSATSSSNLPVDFRVISGPATLSGNTLTLTGAGAVSIEASQTGNAFYSAAPTIIKSFNVLPNSAIQCAATGNISREVWNNVGGNNLTDNIWTNAADVTNLISFFEGPTDVADNYASRIRGYLCAPQTGNYTFWIAGDDATELWLSTDDSPANKRKIAYNVSWTSPREWEKYSTQKSVQIYLEAGKKYYVEALHKEGGGGDNIAVAWQLPNGIKEAPMSGNYLSPFNISGEPGLTTSVSQGLATTKNTKILIGGEIKVYPNPVRSTVIVNLQPVQSGIATLRLYDLQNRLIHVLFDGFLEKNSPKTLQFNCKNLPNGMYCIKYTTGDKQITEKIIIAR